MSVIDPTREAFIKNYRLFETLRERKIRANKSKGAMEVFPVDRPSLLFERGQNTGDYLGHTIQQQSGYAVVARYTNEENEKVLEAVKLLTRIASGHDGIEQGETFAKRVERNFLKQEGERDFSEAVCDSIFECFIIFEQRYPEEIPALHAIFQTAGADGVVLTLRHTSGFLKDAMDGKLTTDNMGTYIKPSMKDFSMPIGPENRDGDLHPILSSVLVSHPPSFQFGDLMGDLPIPKVDIPIDSEIGLTGELQCSGRNFAVPLIKGAIEAAITLSKQDEKWTLKNLPMSSQHRDIITDKVNRAIELIFQKAKEKYI